MKKYFSLILLVILFSCSGTEKNSENINTGEVITVRLKLATTTSTDNSGLLDILIPPFENKTGIKVDVIAVGTGKALELGRNGDVDIVLVHARSAEDLFVEEDYGVNRRDVMHNDFVILGPPDDPANISACEDITMVFRTINENKVGFISRGDDSGTHKKEKQLWEIANISPEGPWYKEIGQGMGAVITMTNDQQVYTIADRGTYLSMKDNIELSICFEGDNHLYNPYGIIAVNPANIPSVKYFEAMSFIAWITSIEGQNLIRNYQVDEEQLFYPDAIE